MPVTIDMRPNPIILLLFIGLFFIAIDTVVPAPASAADSSPPSSNTNILGDMFRQVENSIVQITSQVSTSDPQIVVNGNTLGNQSTMLGSGFIYDNQGHIVTSNDITRGAKTVNVTFVDGKKFAAKVIGGNASTDVAVLQITDSKYSAEKAVPLAIANSSSLRVGQQVISLGNPYGLTGTMTTGQVIHTGRLLPNPNSGFSIPDAIQTDSPVNPGDSGGPLLNMQGQVVGMNVAILSSTGTFSGVAFAIPSNSITQTLAGLVHTGT